MRQHCRPELNISLPSGTVDQRKIDISMLLEHGKIREDTVRCQNKEDRSIQIAVEFILSQDNSQVLSWGTRLIKLDANEKIEMPRIARRKQLSQLWEEDDHNVRNEEDRKKMLRKLSSKITDCDPKSVLITY